MATDTKIKPTPVQERPTSDLRPHAKAEDVPTPDEDQWDEMVLDISQRGIQVPIEILGDGTIVDGRTRWQIAMNLGIQSVPVRVIDPPDPYDYMILAAASRRHLSKSQRAMLLVMSPTWLKIREEAAERIKSGVAAEEGKSSAQEAADKIGVGKTVVDEAAGLMKKAPELAKAIKDGELSTTQATAIMRDTELHDKVKSGVMTPKAAAKSLKSEDQRAKEHDIQRLRTHAPDLADAMENKEITLKGALRILEEREEAVAAEEDTTVNGEAREGLPVKPMHTPGDVLPRQLHEAIQSIRQAPPRAARNKLPDVVKAMLQSGKPWPKGLDGLREYRDSLAEAAALIQERLDATQEALTAAEALVPQPEPKEEAAPATA